MGLNFDRVKGTISVLHEFQQLGYNRCIRILVIFTQWGCINLELGCVWPFWPCACAGLHYKLEHKRRILPTPQMSLIRNFCTEFGRCELFCNNRYLKIWMLQTSNSKI
ncbi:uncharacterized protein LOC133719770 [Rosa rugosa]|uniref:uncharacterized protein LOC133719770 n=1 Tax=Rosa rugosa TaxID=74645 RepID=UPI002B413BE1|nr:uncharacterized protein LOC133719770 [Rosa rugosa]